MDDFETAARLLDGAGTIAVVGLSTNPGKSAHSVPAAMQASGFRIVGVHPSATELLGHRAYQRLADIEEPVDIVNVFRPSAEAADVARQAVAIGARALWLQQGIVSAEARRIAEEAGLAYVEDQCMAVVRALTGARGTAS
ncbi:CoA-binding protein [Amycolatopsis suaedae]|uniref:CoA-binding protein n=1 Tax=Amycolatopsis suaedae TaxID=2510978 RepID=A0A4Q7J2M6_9PSEU|nr:CoA-binding protein [Amycolatopsis suaedae]RZQ61711.1 CoA-binding protein [Amycolatopsis suaedae]